MFRCCQSEQTVEKTRNSRRHAGHLQYYSHFTLQYNTGLLSTMSYSSKGVEILMRIHYIGASGVHANSSVQKIKT